MSIPSRLADGRPATFFVTSTTLDRRRLLQSHRMSQLFIEVLYKLRAQEEFLLHEFVLMPDHFHLMITPRGPVSTAVQRIKGSVSHAAGKRFSMKGTIWQRGFSEHAIRDGDDFYRHQHYIWNNPVKKRMVDVAAEYEYSTALFGRFATDLWALHVKAPGAKAQ